ncbi:endo-beta-N-acetylglucosaminidase H [Flexivirga meconopsidis]|uniref:endo-beta-N-acetylglucosaminidase H n=1 Tax=Flexivirga meconopsidis TaxID=2977121 RepID=UPI00223F0A11
MPHPVSRRSLLAAVPGIALAGSVVAAPSARACGAGAKSGPRTICYVEVNSNELANAGRYSLAGSGAPLFDVAVIFAANINYDGTAAYLYCNPQVQATLDNAATQIRPLQQRGIKVLLSVLGNHQGAGVCNFPTEEAASAFAGQLAAIVDRYDLDGIDFDDEYADYGVNGTGQPNASSFVQLVTALRRAMPDKLISFYYYGPAASRTTYNGVQAGASIDLCGNAIYGTYSVPNVPGMGKAALSPAAVKLSETPSSTAASFATRTVSDGYGLFLTYDLRGGDQSAYLSSFSTRLYGEAVVHTG